MARKLKSDRILFLTTILLVAVSIVMVYSASTVMADERYFVVRAENASSLSRDGWTAQKAEVMTEQKWWSRDELSRTSATVSPEDLLEMLATVANPQN